MRLFLRTLLIVASFAPAIASAQDIEHGEYVFHAAGCAACHTDVDNNGPWLAGGRALKTPLGTFYSPNITPDPETGIGGWSDEDFLRAMTRGISPDGSHYYPAFPYTSYTRMTRADIRALKHYLFSLPPVSRPNREHDLPWYLSFRPLLWFWKLLYFDEGQFERSVEQSDAWNRGAYLGTALGHCAECHSPRNRFGAIVENMRMAGARNGPGGEVVPNITPHRETGIGRWPAGDLMYFFQTGETPSGDYTGGEMAEVIDEGLGRLRQDDLKALATWLLSLEPVEHRLERPKKKKREQEKEDWE